MRTNRLLAFFCYVTFSYGLYTKIVTNYPLMCVAVVALSLAILLLCFITFIAFYCPVVCVNS